MTPGEDIAINTETETQEDRASWTSMIVDGSKIEIDKDVEEKFGHFKPSWWIMMLYFLAGWSQVKIAKELGISPVTVSLRWNNPEFKEAWNTLNSRRNEKGLGNYAKVKENFDRNSLLAEETLVSLMLDEDTPASVRASTARDILDRAGHKPKERIEVEGTQAIPIYLQTSGYDPLEEDPFYTQQKDLGRKITGSAISNPSVEEDENSLDALDQELTREG